MEPWAIVLVVTVVVGILVVLFIIVAALVSENKLSKSNNSSTTSGITGGSTGGSTGGVTQLCSGPGLEPQVPPPSYTRISPKSTCRTPLARSIPPFDTVTHTVQRLHRVRSITQPLSPNHWISNATYDPTDSLRVFSVYPYIASIQDTGLHLAWPSPGTLTEGSNLTGEVGSNDLFFTSSWGPTLMISGLGEKPESCDILDIDALVVTAAWQYQNTVTRERGHLTIPLAQGSPFITVEVHNVGASIRCSFGAKFEEISPTAHVITIDDDSGYLLVLSRVMTPIFRDNVVNMAKFTGVFRLAYFDSEATLSTLVANADIYPIESTIGTTSTLSGTTWTIHDTYTWTTASMVEGSNQELLMMALPHHTITNTTFTGPSIDHPILGPTHLVLTSNDTWNVQNTISTLPLQYPSLGSAKNTTLTLVWNTEIDTIIKSEPPQTAQWMRWIGSLAMMVMMGNMLGTDIGTAHTLLKDRLNRIRINRGVVSTSNQFVYDRTWGGIIGKMGLNNCSGDFDSGNAFYQSPIGQYGYVVYAYTVASTLDVTFREQNREIALSFARHIANPCDGDRYFPLWRSKNWYLGYSISSGLQPHQPLGKETTNPGEAVFGYYACYLLGSVLNVEELATWNLSMLASEITALQHYFQFTSTTSITVDPAFVQGTITERGDTYYNYTVPGGNITFPARNASIMVPVVKPLTLSSDSYLNTTWATQTQTWMTGAAATPSIQPESLLYALSLLAVNGNNLPQISETIVHNRSTALPYGSTWSAALYWVLSQ